MIRKESFAVSTEAFAAERKDILARSDEELRPHIAEALTRIGLPSWQLQIVNAALDVFDTTARAEVDEWNHVLDDMRDMFAKELGDALEQTKTAANKEAQTDTITRWVSTMAVNAGTEAATTSDTSANVGLEWITMGDSSVREPHKEANGQTVPTGQAFEVGGEKMLYPGQPVGDPSNWINCRCVARPAMLDGDFKSKGISLEESGDSSSLLASADPEQVFTTAVIVALPADSDPVTAVSSEADGAHCTLLFLGDTANLDREALLSGLDTFVTHGQVGVMTENVSGRATLGKDSADVVLIDGNSLTPIRNGLLEQNNILAAYDAVEQFPNFIPHVTLGYPDTPALGEFSGESITFDRLALWFGEDRSAIYPLGETMPEKDPAPDAGFAAAPPAPAVAEEKPVEPAPAAEAPAAPAAGGSDLRPWHGVLAPEGSPSGDKREFAERMLTTRDLPLPIKAMFADGSGHDGSVVVARIDRVFRDGGLIKAEGVWDDSPDANRAYDLVDKKMWRGVSVDLDAAEGEMVEAAEEGGQPSIQFSKGRISAATLCAIPAFAEAFVRNGTWAEFANEPLPTGLMNEIPDWPAEEVAPAFSLVASAAPAVSADFFRNPMLEGPTPVTRGEDGLVFGHLGVWEACHIGYDICTTVPRSATDYAYFLTGQVFTDAGPVAVGQLTVGGGHADGKLGVRAAIAHYDNVAAAVADITVGEDDYGVWFSGQLRPWATEQQIHELFAAGPSGDWRSVRYRGQESMEMIAAHAVNVPGFPIPRPRFAMEGTRQVSLVAAGVPQRKPAKLDPKFAEQMQAYVAQQKRIESVNNIKASIRTKRVADIKKRITNTKGR